ncbi:serine/threonine-protein kinase [Yinghuangia seranimata]|uniref:serine/threonine-protein kinase n=1 Tax=Yinghuangia seranimata TaxID=408067 RepID=UPI00248ADEE4|nr:protein kinase [Yinghuangia seranimata]MDI2124836.1 protein kinase [Yinghuangia seranimata]
MAVNGITPLDAADPVRLGTYRLLGRLGAGGMGRVYLARSTDGSLAAVKTLLTEGDVADTDRRRFAREVALARRVDSPFTARVRDADPDARRPWMAIDYIAAPPLTELVRFAGKLPASAVRWTAAGTARALIALHDEGVVHRDVKPQNILLPLNGPRLIDFGISHATDMTRTALTLGTIAFTSPEQSVGQPSTEASDVYSLGATLFYTAVGRPPYADESDMFRLLEYVRTADVQLDGLPQELYPLISACLARDPNDRPGPRDLLDYFARDLDRAPTSLGGDRWLPGRWSDLIEEYAKHGRELADNPERFMETVQAGTRVGKPPKQDRKPPEPKKRAPKQDETPKKEPAKKDAAKKASAKRVPLKAEAPKAEAPKKEPPKAEPPKKTEPPKNKSDDGWGVMLVILAVIGLVIWHPWSRGDDSNKSNTSSTRSPYSYASSGLTSGGSTSGGSTSGSSTSGSSSSGSNAYGTGGSGSSGGSSSTSGGGAAPRTTPARTQSSEDKAFAAISAGDCLDAYSDGYGKWSSSVPNDVSCGGANAYLRVSSVRSSSGACAAGAGQSVWWHVNDDISTTALCVERQFRSGQCFLAEKSGDTVGSANLMTVWNCSADKVPVAFDYIMQITAVYAAGTTTSSCPSVPNHYSYSWTAWDGRLICAKVA